MRVPGSTAATNVAVVVVVYRQEGYEQNGSVLPRFVLSLSLSLLEM